MKSHKRIKNNRSSHADHQLVSEKKLMSRKEVYQDFLLEQKNLEDTVSHIINNGGFLTDSKLLVLSQKLDRIIFELHKINDQE